VADPNLIGVEHDLLHSQFVDRLRASPCDNGLSRLQLAVVECARKDYLLLPDYLPLAPLVHVVLYNGDPTGISVLVSQPLEDALGGMLLLWLAAPYLPPGSGR